MIFFAKSVAGDDKNSEVRFTEWVAGNKNQEVLMLKAVAGVVKNPQEVLI